MTTKNEMSIDQIKWKIERTWDKQSAIDQELLQLSCERDVYTILLRNILSLLLERCADKATAFRSFRSEVAQAIARQAWEEDERMQIHQTKMNRGEEVLNPVGELVGVKPEKLTLLSRS